MQTVEYDIVTSDENTFHHAMTNWNKTITWFQNDNFVLVLFSNASFSINTANTWITLSGFSYPSNVEKPPHTVMISDINSPNSTFLKIENDGVVQVRASATGTKTITGSLLFPKKDKVTGWIIN